MESRLHYALQGKHLCLLGRESIVTDGGLELKGKGSLDTVSGNLQYRGTLMKHFSLNDHTMIGMETLTVGAGLGVASTASSDPSDPFISCRVKHVHALSRAWDTKGAIKLQADVPANLSKRNKDTIKFSARLSKRFLKFTDTQDVELKIGADVKFSPQTKADLYFQVRENNWALKLKRGSWQILYDL